MLLDGKKIALEIQEEIKTKISQLEGRKPCLTVVLVGDNPASVTYVTMKQKSCKDVGISSQLIKLPSSLSEESLLNEIKRLNADPEVDGILVQLPLPSHIDPSKVFSTIDPHKDVDCFHPMNVGKLTLGDTTGFIPCTPKGIQLLIAKSNIEVSGKHVVILGRSNLVGKPLALLLMQKGPFANATVTVVHSLSKNLKEICSKADILIVAIGSARFIKADMVKEGAVVIDVGIHRSEDGLIGDVDFNAVQDKCAYITPVPGGVGPMTIAMLLANTLLAYELRDS